MAIKSHHLFVLSKSDNLVSLILELIAKAVSDLKDSKSNYLPIALIFINPAGKCSDLNT